MPGCSSGCRRSCWTSSARPADWTGRGGAWTPSACVRHGGDHVGANPVDRAKPGSKLHLAVEGGGLPLSVLVTGANTGDSLVFEVAGRPPAGAHPSGSAALPPGEGPRGQGVRPSRLPQLPDPPGDQGPHRPVWGGVVDAAGPPPLEGGALDRLAGRVSAAAGALRPGLRAVLCVRDACLRPAVLQPAAVRGCRPVTMIPVSDRRARRERSPPSPNP